MASQELEALEKVFIENIDSLGVRKEARGRFAS